MNMDINLNPGIFELRSLLRSFYEDSKYLPEKDKIEKANEYKEDMQKLFKVYDWYSLLSEINSTDDVDRKIVFFLQMSGIRTHIAKRISLIALVAANS